MTLQFGNPHSRTHKYGTKSITQGWDSEAAVEHARKVTDALMNN